MIDPAGTPFSQRLINRLISTGKLTWRPKEMLGNVLSEYRFLRSNDLQRQIINRQLDRAQATANATPTFIRRVR